MKTDVRVIAATNVDLLNAVSRGKFRADLYYRLNSVVIKMPALRERPADIHLLFRKFASDFSAKYGMAKVALTDDAAIMLRKYRWPGNIRQLKNIAEAVSSLESSKMAPGMDKCMVDADVLSRYIPKEEPNLLPATVQQQDKFESGEREVIIRTLFQLKQEVDYLKEVVEKAGLGRMGAAAIQSPAQQEEIEQWQPPVAEFDDPEEQDPEDQVLDETPEQISIKEASFELIEKVLRKHGGNRKAAAAELEISERTLYRKLKQMQK
jgi:transcriptional regulator with PAS, ATPase and Fis domain